MFVPNGWFATTRAILELLYFASGIVIAIAAVWALTQIRLTKQIAKSNARRESVKLAADLCKYFAESVVPIWAKANDEYKTQQLKYLTVSPPEGQPAFVIKDGEIVSHHFNVKQLPQDLAKHNLAVTYLNTLEAFAIPFAEGVADEDIGYRETARPFCQGAQLYMPAIFQLRVQNAGRFESIVKLNSAWTNRLAADAVAPVLKIMMQLEKAGEKRIKPLDQGY
jgi:hypothetical protein